MDIITLSEYKTFEGKTKPDDDVKTEILIGAVSNLIKTYLGTSAPSDPNEIQTDVIFVDYETDRLYTKYYPIREIVSITETGRNPNDSTVHLPLLAGSDYILAGEYIARIPGSSLYTWWPVSPGYVTVQYKAGELNVDGTTPLPQNDIKLAAIELVNYYLKKEYIQNRSVMGTSISTYVDNGGMPPHIAKLLDRYKSYI